MPHLAWSLLAQSQAVDRETNAQSIFNIIEEVTIPADVKDPPSGEALSLGPSFACLQLWMRDQPEKAETASARVAVIGPNSQRLGEISFSVDLSDHPRTRAVLNLPFFPYMGPGTYSFVTEIQTGTDAWSPVSACPIVVKKAQ